MLLVSADIIKLFSDNSYFPIQKFVNAENQIVRIFLYHNCIILMQEISHQRKIKT